MRCKKLTVYLALCAALCLSACAGIRLPPLTEEPSPSPAPALTPQPVPSGPPYDVPGVEEKPAPAAEEEPRETDGYEGAYYNDYLGMTLSLDGLGGCTLLGPEGTESGTYYAGEDGNLSLSFDQRRESAHADADGDLRLEGRTGYFLRNWDLWGITAAEAGLESVEATPEPEPGDALRWRDPEIGVALSYAPGLEVLPDVIAAGVAVHDRDVGWVTVRNVTEIYLTHSGSADEFLLDYTRNFVFADYALLYSKADSYAGLTALHEGIDGRLAAVTLSLQSAGVNTYVRVLLYTSTYADGTVNYICKAVYAGPNALDAMERSVTDAGAARYQLAELQ